MEEEIKGAIERLSKAQYDIGYATLYSQEEQDKDIEILIKGYKELEKENKELLEVKISANAHNRIMELEEENEQLEAIKDEAIRRYNFETIPKSKVKEKIEELDEERSYELTKIDEMNEYREFAMNILQELLEDGD